ncbi:hypothetical protein DFH09DRAFT_1100129 [Mycena vulgaris]|nr:hypothetical protein DFH09DRAFT_1100129 [Mycena vulgaris]
MNPRIPWLPESLCTSKEPAPKGNYRELSQGQPSWRKQSEQFLARDRVQDQMGDCKSHSEFALPSISLTGDLSKTIKNSSKWKKKTAASYVPQEAVNCPIQEVLPMLYTLRVK